MCAPFDLRTSQMQSHTTSVAIGMQIPARTDATYVFFRLLFFSLTAHASSSAPPSEYSLASRNCISVSNIRATRSLRLDYVYRTQQSCFGATYVRLYTVDRLALSCLSKGQCPGPPKRSTPTTSSSLECGEARGSCGQNDQRLRCARA